MHRTLFSAILLSIGTFGATAGHADAPQSAAGQAPVKSAPQPSRGMEHSAGDGHDHSQDANAEVRKPFGGSASNLDFLWARSDQAFHDGDYERAVSLHRAIVALDPTDAESYGVAAWLLWSMGKGDEAIAHLQRGITLNPQDSDIWAEAGENYNLQKKFPEATNAFSQAVKFAPPGANTLMLRRLLAHAAEKSGDLALSVATWQGLVTDFPNDAVNKNNLARIQKIQAGEPLTDTESAASGEKQEGSRQAEHATES